MTSTAVAASGDTAASIAAVHSALDRIVQGSPILVLIVTGMSYLIWRTWRTERAELLEMFRKEREARELKWQEERAEILEKWRLDRQELLAELREEREARNAAHREIAAVGDRGTQATLAVREALLELRHAIEKGERR